MASPTGWRRAYELTYPALREGLAGRHVAIVNSGSNIDQETLRRVMWEGPR